MSCLAKVDPESAIKEIEAFEASHGFVRQDAIEALFHNVRPLVLRFRTPHVGADDHDSGPAGVVADMVGRCDAVYRVTWPRR